MFVIEDLQVADASDATGGEPVMQYTLKNLDDRGMSIVVCNYGCTILSILAADKEGVVEEVTLNHRSYSELIKPENHGPYYGAIVGRVANRIQGGTFNLNGQTYHIAKNTGEGQNTNTLHGGLVGFDQKVFKCRTTIAQDGDGDGYARLELSYLSPDGEEGFPGALKVTVTYTLTARNELVITYKAHLVTEEGEGEEEKEEEEEEEGMSREEKKKMKKVVPLSTTVNLTNHTYFNLSGNLRNNILGHSLQLSCSSYTPYDEQCIPTGEIVHVEKTLFDFCSFGIRGVPLAERVRFIDAGGRPGLDHNWVVDGAIEAYSIDVPDTTRLRHVATLTEPVSGRVLTVRSTQPGIQVYTNNWASEDSKLYPHIQHNAIALETQHFPNSCNVDSFPKGSILKQGETYSHTAVFCFSLMEK